MDWVLPPLTMFKPTALILLSGLGLALVSSAAADLPTKEDPRLIPVYSSRRVWNGIATTREGRAFASFPSADGPGVGCEELFTDGQHHAYPNAQWNSYPGASAKHAFVHVNALRIGPEGDLWIVDAGAAGIGQAAVKGGARLFQVDLASNTIRRIYDLARAVHHLTYVDDVRFNRDNAYLTDAGEPGIIILNLQSGNVRRVLDGDPSTVDGRDMYADERLLVDADGKSLRAHADQLEISPDGKYFYYQPASGPLARIETRWLEDVTLSDSERSSHVEQWLDTPTSGGTAIDADGNLYLSDTKERRILKITPDKAVTVLIADPRLIWSDAMWIDAEGCLWIPATQQNLTPGFDHGRQEVRYPVWIYKMQIGAKPAPNDHS